jgi:hypothetical protein
MIKQYQGLGYDTNEDYDFDDEDLYEERKNDRSRRNQVRYDSEEEDLASIFEGGPILLPEILSA